jgi:DNA replication protein DnaC
MTSAYFDTLHPYSDERLTLAKLRYITEAHKDFWSFFEIPPEGIDHDTMIPEPVREQVRNWVRNYDEGSSMLLIGNVGTGKTSLACRLLRYLIDKVSVDGRQIRPLFEVNFTTERSIINGRKPGGDITNDIFRNHYCKPQLLVIDEIGACKSSEFVEDTMLELISYRYSSLLTTILTTNMGVEDLVSRLGERVVDRLLGKRYEQVLMEGRSLR